MFAIRKLKGIEMKKGMKIRAKNFVFDTVKRNMRKVCKLFLE